MLLTPALAPVRVRVTDLVLSLTNRLGQLVGPKELRITFLDNGCCNIWLELKTTRHLLLADGSILGPAPAGYAPADDVHLVATADCAVEPTEGSPRYRKIAAGLPASEFTAARPGSALNLATNQIEQFEIGQSWLDYLQAKPEPLLTQDRFFGLVCAREAITIWDLVSLYIQQADTAPSRFLPATA